MSIHVCPTSFDTLNVAGLMEVIVSKFGMVHVFLRNSMMRIVVVGEAWPTLGVTVSIIPSSVVVWCRRSANAVWSVKLTKSLVLSPLYERCE
jgi:hypothetical protein